MMLRSFVFAAIAANLVALLVSAADTSETTTTKTRLETYMEEHNYGTEDIAIVKKVAKQYDHMQLSRALRRAKTYPYENSLMSSVFDLYLIGAEAVLRDSDSSGAEMLAALGVDSAEQVEKFLPVVTGMVNADTDSYKSESYLKLFGDTNAPYADALVTKLEALDVSISHVDYTAPADAAATMTAWVQNKTSNDATNILTEKSFNSDTKAILLGAAKTTVYWSSDVTVEETCNDIFQRHDGKNVTIQYTKVSAPVKVGQDDHFNIEYVTVPLAGSCEFTCLWNSVDNEQEFLNTLHYLGDPEILTGVLSKGETKTSTVLFPTSTTNMSARQHIAMDLKMTGGFHGLLSPNDNSVCSGIYSDSTDCGHVSIAMQEISVSIETKASGTTERRRRDTSDTSDSTTSDSATVTAQCSSDSSDASESNLIKLNKSHMCLYQCPIETGHYVALNLGGA